MTRTKKKSSSKGKPKNAQPKEEKKNQQPQQEYKKFFIAPNEMLVKILQKYPEAFSPIPNKMKPLKLRIDKDMRDEMHYPIKAIQEALDIYVKQTAYIEKLAQGGARYDLTGKKVQEISEEHQQSAQRCLDIRAKKHAEWLKRKQAEKENAEKEGKNKEKPKPKGKTPKSSSRKVLKKAESMP